MAREPYNLLFRGERPHSGPRTTSTSLRGGQPNFEARTDEDPHLGVAIELSKRADALIQLFKDSYPGRKVPKYGYFLDQAEREAAQKQARD